MNTTSKKRSPPSSQKKNLNNKKKNKKPNVSQKRKPRIPNNSLVVTATIPMAPGSTNIVTIHGQMSTTAIPMIGVALYSFLTNKGFGNVAHECEPDKLLSGMMYMLDSLAKGASGITSGIEQAPILFHELSAALKPKQLRYLTNAKISFGWEDVPPPQFVVPTQGRTWLPTYVADGGSSFASPAVVWTGTANADNYPYFISFLNDQASSGRLNVVANTYAPQLVNDVSSFARSYTYNGQFVPTSAGGYYRNLESEVNITCPLVSCFSPYGISQDTRVPLKLAPFSGDPCSNIGSMLYKELCPNYFNKIPPIYKLIDFEYIYTTLCIYMVRLIEEGLNTNMSDFPAGTMLNFTQQDFRIALRQALLTVFEHQHLVQFIAPLVANNNNNSFQPFMVSGHNCVNREFAKMLVPKLIQENLAALRARVVRIPRKTSTINQTVILPVLGNYVQDTPAVFTYKSPNSTQRNPLFLPPTQAEINITDCTNSGNPICANNSYYYKVLENWNYYVQQFAKFSSETTAISGDSGPIGLGLLGYTTIVSSPPSSTTTATPSLMSLKYSETVSNSKQMSRSDSKKQIPVTAIPPASILNLVSTGVTSIARHTSEEMALLDFLIPPSIRLDDMDATDALNTTMYQIEVKEPHLIRGTQPTSNSANGASMYSRLAKLAYACVPGLAKQTSNEYDSLMIFLSAKGQAGFLSNILGGIAKNLLPADRKSVV